MNQSLNSQTRAGGGGQREARAAAARHIFHTDEQRWSALQIRDARAEGEFVYSVRSTGIYCRPTCPSRLAFRENIGFHKTCAEAELAGFRPCKRCRPDGVSQRDRHAEVVTRACHILEASDPPPSLDALAREVGMSRYYFHRVFKEVVGVTPREYASARRTARVHSELRGRGSVTEAIYGAGFNSSGRFYERSHETLGMTPGQFRSGGQGIVMRYAIAPCPLGLVLVAGTARGICAVRFGDQRASLERELRDDFPKATLGKADDVFKTWLAAIVNHIKRPAGSIELPLDIRGTVFQQRVWQALRDIPSGKTASYSEVAARIGAPSAVRAVASACAANPVAVIVPCHRVVRSNGDLSGYRWGVGRKRQLLKRERAA